MYSSPPNKVQKPTFSSSIPEPVIIAKPNSLAKSFVAPTDYPVVSAGEVTGTKNTSLTSATPVPRSQTNKLVCNRVTKPTTASTPTFTGNASAGSVTH